MFNYIYQNIILIISQFYINILQSYIAIICYNYILQLYITVIYYNYNHNYILKLISQAMIYQNCILQLYSNYILYNSLCWGLINLQDLINDLHKVCLIIINKIDQLYITIVYYNYISQLYITVIYYMIYYNIYHNNTIIYCNYYHIVIIIVTYIQFTMLSPWADINLPQVAGIFKAI